VVAAHREHDAIGRAGAGRGDQREAAAAAVQRTATRSTSGGPNDRA
jgi:hypothetical protein